MNLDDLNVAVSAISSASEHERAALLAWLSALEDDASAKPVEVSTTLQNVAREAMQVISLGGLAPPATLALLVTSAHYVRAEVLRQAPRIELIWTGPSLTATPLRSTRQAVSRIIREASRYVLVVGYELREAKAADANFVDECIEAARRGVRFTFVLNEDRLSFLSVNLGAWPAINRPHVLTWVDRPDALASLHAKVVVSDDAHALVTSANLTYHGLSQNIELGLLVEGDVALQLRRHFVALERLGVVRVPDLVPDPGSWLGQTHPRKKGAH